MLVPTGNVIAIRANMITSIPSPKFDKRVLSFTKIPVITFSIPTINKRKETRITRETNDIIGLIIINIAKIIANIPIPIWTAKIHLGRSLLLNMCPTI